MNYYSLLFRNIRASLFYLLIYILLVVNPQCKQQADAHSPLQLLHGIFKGLERMCKTPDYQIVYLKTSTTRLRHGLDSLNLLESFDGSAQRSKYKVEQ